MSGPMLVAIHVGVALSCLLIMPMSLGGHMAGARRCWLVNKPYNTLCFCVFDENGQPETSQAQHIQLAINLIKTLILLMLRGRHPLMVHGGRIVVLACQTLQKKLIKPCPFVYLMKVVNQKLHKHNTSNLQKKHILLVFSMRGRRPLRAHGGRMAVPACQKTL